MKLGRGPLKLLRVPKGDGTWTRRAGEAVTVVQSSLAEVRILPTRLRDVAHDARRFRRPAPSDAASIVSASPSIEGHGESLLGQLPTHLLDNVLTHLDSRSLVQFANTSRGFREFVRTHPGTPTLLAPQWAFADLEGALQLAKDGFVMSTGLPTSSDRRDLARAGDEEFGPRQRATLGSLALSLIPTIRGSVPPTTASLRMSTLAGLAAMALGDDAPSLIGPFAAGLALAAGSAEDRRPFRQQISRGLNLARFIVECAALPAPVLQPLRALAEDPEAVDAFTLLDTVGRITLVRRPPEWDATTLHAAAAFACSAGLAQLAKLRARQDGEFEAGAVRLLAAAARFPDPIEEAQGDAGRAGEIRAMLIRGVAQEYNLLPAAEQASFAQHLSTSDDRVAIRQALSEEDLTTWTASFGFALPTT